MKRTISFATLVLLTGCISQLNVTYACNPVGAKLVEDGTGQIFDCPTTLSYSITPAQDNAVNISLDGLTAIWVSGAKTHVPKMNVNLANGPNQQFVFMRDPTAPGAYVDAQYALQLQTLTTQQGFLANQQATLATQQQQMQIQQQQINQQNLNNAAALLARALTQQKPQ